MINVVLRQTLVALLALSVLSACDKPAPNKVNEPPVHLEDKSFHVLELNQKAGIVSCSAQTFSDGARVRLDWKAVENTPGTYQVYRAKDLSNDWARITSTPISALTLLDTTVVNGGGYRYRVELLPAAGGSAIDLCGDELNAFVAFNTEAPHSCISTVSNSAGTVKLDWKMPTAMRARILHRYDSVTPRDGFIQLTETTTALLKDSYLHQKPIYGTRNYYQIVSVRDFTNPYSGAKLSIAGGNCATDFQIDSALKIEIDNTYLISEAMWRLSKAPGPVAKVSGTIYNAAGPVLMKFSSYNPATNPQVIEKRVEGPRFYIELPHLYDTWHWNLEAADTEAVLNQTRRYLQVRNVVLTPTTLSQPTHGWTVHQYAETLTLNNIVGNTPLASYNVPIFYATQVDNKIWRYNSWLKVDEAGEHCFAVDNAGLAQLWLQNTKLIDVATAVQPFAHNTACAQLTPGYYAIDLRHRANQIPRHLRVYWRAPGRMWEPLDEQRIWTNKRSNFVDSDTDGYADDIDRFPNNALEVADLDADGVGERADDDRDGDGVANLTDAYPRDPSRLSNEASQPLQISWSASDKALTLRWPTLLQGESLQLFKMNIDGQNASLIQQFEVGSNSYVLSNVANNSSYRFAALKTSSIGLSDPLSFEPIVYWAAWNDLSLTSCEASVIPSGIKVQWLPTQQAAQLSRKLNGANPNDLGPQSASPFVDTQVRHGGRYEYQLNTTKRMLNPITGLNVDLPDSNPCVSNVVTMQSSVNLTLSGADRIDDTHYQKRPTYIGEQTVTGHIANAFGPVKVTAKSADKTIDIVSHGDDFTSSLPVDAAHTQWQINVEETEAITTSAVSVAIDFVLDTVPPTITLAATPTLTYLPTIKVEGQINDNLSAIASASLISTAGTQILSLDSSGHFVADVALSEGQNSIQIVAVDAGQMSSDKSFTIERDSSAPQLVLVAPSNTDDTYDAAINVQYRIVWRHDAAALTASINNQAIAIQSANNMLTMSVSDYALIEGRNDIVSKVVSPVGETSRTLTITRRVDRTPPTIVIDPITTPTTQNESIQLSGRVTDDRSGVQRVWLSSDRVPGTFGIVLDNNGVFNTSQPLETGDNRFTVHAVDERNNEASASVVITRDTDRPTVTVVSPIEGTVTDQNFVDVVATITHYGAPSELQFSVNGQAGTIASTNTAKQYRATLNHIALQKGSNALLVRLVYPRGVLEESRHITVDADQANQNDVPPALELRSPLSGAVLTQRDNTVELAISASARPLSLTFNQQHLSDNDVRWLDNAHARVSVPFTFADNSSSFTAQITLTDSKNRSTQLSANYTRDAQAPVIRVDRLLAEPALNEVIENPFLLSGRVQDERLASVTINEQPITVQPGSTSGEHRFELPLSLTPNVEQVIIVSAKDAAGNVSSSSYRLKASSVGSIKILLPVANAEFVTEGATFALDVTAQVEGDVQSTQVVARIDNGEWQTLNRDGRIVQANIISPIGDGQHQLTVELRQNSDDRVLAREQRNYSLKNLQQIPLQLIRVQPVNGAQNIEPNDFIAVHFNKAFDASKLRINVRETAHGLTYENHDTSGTDFTHAKGAELVEVNRANETVMGSVSILPGQQSAAFYPVRDLAYNGEVFVDVEYDGQTISRTNYHTRALPTLLGGNVVDPLGQAVVGIEVSLPDLSRSTTTDRDGVYSFGFGESADKALPAGRHRLVVNALQKNGQFSSVEKWVTLQEGRLQNESSILLPYLNNEVPYRVVSGGRSDVSLAEGELHLDLSNARLTFPDGNSSGGVHAQLLQFHEMPKPFAPYAVPMWVYDLQPYGIRFSGEVGVRITMPQLNGGYDYLLVKKFYTVMMGASDDGSAIVPIAVGLVDNNQFVSVGALHTHRLDQFGFTMLPFALQDKLQAYANGEMSWDALLSLLQNELTKDAR